MYLVRNVPAPNPEEGMSLGGAWVRLLNPSLYLRIIKSTPSNWDIRAATLSFETEAFNKILAANEYRKMVKT